ncbi:MAG: fumarylacetoacetate hydrolase family protein [Idiomarina sp.]|nr:fumarylacetoacetate hydrolase family protein [Idiomarina sp.]
MKHNKVIAIGRNYAAHAQELNNPIPDEPLLFMKPSTAIVPFEEPIDVSSVAQPVHYELEIAVLLGKDLKNADAVDALNGIDGLGLALDLTLRQLQDELKSKGQPWEKAKAFDGSCPVSQFIALGEQDLRHVPLELQINGEVRQSATSADMLMPITELIQYASQFFTLCAGDIVLTGTPAGVGVLKAGDQLQARLGNMLQVSTHVV